MAEKRPVPPPRPYIPPSAALAAAVCLGAALMLNAGWVLRDTQRIIPKGVALALCGAAAGMLLGARLVGCCAISGPAPGWPGRPSPLMRALLRYAAFGLIVAVVASAGWLMRWSADAARVEGRSLSSFTVTVEGDPSIGEFGASSTAVLRDGIGIQAARVRLNAAVPLEQGRVMRAVGRIEPLDDSDWGRSRFMKGEVASVQLVSILEELPSSHSLIDRLREGALGVIDPACGDARALLAGTICGRTTELNRTEANDAFSRCGLTHLVAVSGSHLAFIAALLETGLKRTGLGSAPKRAVLLTVMAVYVIFTGGAPSALRSVSMVGLTSAAMLGGRRPHALSGLALVITAMVALNPGVVFDLGFQLSALSVLFILALGPYVTYALGCLHVPGLLAEALGLTLVAQWATLPITVPVFGEASLIAPLANVLVGPVMTALLVVGLITVPLAMILPIPILVLALPDAPANASIFLARSLAGMPYASLAVEGSPLLPIVAYGPAVAVFLCWPRVRPTRLAALCATVAGMLVLHVARWAVFAPPQVIVLNVGQGDAILIRDGPHTMLVDAGLDEATRSALARNNVWHLDAVVVTHWDRDHWGGLPSVLESTPVDRLIVAAGAGDAVPEDLAQDVPPLIELARGDTLNVGAFSCSMVWPQEPVEGEENADSLCLDVRYGGAAHSAVPSLSVLLTGDTERDELAEYADEVGDIDVLKVGHHGSSISLSPEPLRILQPELAIASAGRDNPYGHPSREACELAEQAGAAFLCTMDAGDIVIEPRGRGPRVRVSR